MSGADTFWKPVKHHEGHWLLQRGVGARKVFALRRDGRQRKFKFYELASVAAERLNDEIPRGEREALRRAGETF